MFFLIGVLPICLPLISYAVCKYCNFTYKDFKNFSPKSIFDTILVILFVLLLSTPLREHGLNLSIDDILEDFNEIDYIVIVAHIIVIKIMYASMIYTKKIPVIRD